MNFYKIILKLNNLIILNQKKTAWSEIPKYVIDAFFQIKEIQNLSTDPKGNSLEKDMSFDTKLLGKIYCKKIIDFFEKFNSK